MRSLGEKAVGVYYSGDSEFLLGPVEFELLDRAATSHNPISFCEWCRKKVVQHWPTLWDIYLELSSQQLEVRGKNSRKMSGLELQIWVTWTKKCGHGCGWYFPWRERRGPKAHTPEESPPFVGRGEERSRWKRQHGFGSPISPVHIGATPRTTQRTPHKSQSCNLSIITVWVLKWSFWLSLHSISFLFHLPLPSWLAFYLWYHFIP